MKRHRNEAIAPNGARVLFPTLAEAFHAAFKWAFDPAIVRSVELNSALLAQLSRSPSSPARDGRYFMVSTGAAR